MRSASSYRGQPLVALATLLAGWVAVRVMVRDAVMPDEATSARPDFVVHARGDRTAHPSLAKPAMPVFPASRSVTAFSPTMTVPPRFGQRPLPSSYAPPLLRAPSRAALVPRVVPGQLAAPVGLHVSAAHQLLWMEALARLPLPSGALAAAAPAAPAVPTYRDARWSADGWLLLRPGGQATPVAGFMPATYGASQAGAVVRYRLAPQSPHRPTAYLRVSAALDGVRDREAAVGLSARPVAGVPLVAAAEARVSQQQTGTKLRPAAFVYTELPPFGLPLRARGEFYGQAGYVGGDFATAFVDGQLRVDHGVTRLGSGELRAGVGAWGGAQKGASRLDFGPTAVLGMPITGTASARLALDWRFRVSGNAAPASGSALTLSAGF